MINQVWNEQMHKVGGKDGFGAALYGQTLVFQAGQRQVPMRALFRMKHAIQVNGSADITICLMVI